MFDIKITKQNIKELIRCMNVFNTEHDFKYDNCYDEIQEKFFYSIMVKPKNEDRQWDIFIRVICKNKDMCEKEFYKLINDNIFRVMHYDIVQNNTIGFFRLVKHI